MGRVLFPTGNDVGVRTLSGETLGSDYASFRAPAEPAPRAAQNLVTLGVAVSTAEYLPYRTYQNGGAPIVYRPPILPAPRPSPIQPVGPAFPTAPVGWPTPVSPTPVSSLPIVVAQPAPAPPVSQQSSPTPVVNIPPAAPAPPLVTSGGGTAAPNVAPAAPVPTPVTYTNDAAGNIVNAQTGALVVPAAQAAASGVSAASMNAASAPAVAGTGITDQIAAWLGGSTPIGTWSVPNALLAGAVILGFAFLESGSSTTRRR